MTKSSNGPVVKFIYDEDAEKLTHAVYLDGSTEFTIKSHNGEEFSVEFESGFESVSVGERRLFKSDPNGELTIELTTAEIREEGYGYAITQASHTWDPRVMPGA